MVDISRINNTMGKMVHYLGNHDSVCVSVSGGSDSDIVSGVSYSLMNEFNVRKVPTLEGIEYPPKEEK